LRGPFAFRRVPDESQTHPRRPPAGLAACHAQGRAAHAHRGLAGAGADLCAGAAQWRVHSLCRTWTSLRRAYVFENLQSFLDIYHAGARCCAPSRTSTTWPCLPGCVPMPTTCCTPRSSSIRRHTPHARVSMETVVNGLHRACTDAKEKLGMSAALILCFLRHLSEEEAFERWSRRCPTATGSSASGWHPARSGIRRRSSPGCSRAAANWAFTWWPMPARRARRPMSGGAGRAEGGAHRPRRAGHADALLMQRPGARPHPADGVPAVQPQAVRVPHVGAAQPGCTAGRGHGGHGQLRRPGLLWRVPQRELHQTFAATGLQAQHAYTLARNSFEASFIDAQLRRRMTDRLDEFVLGA
jgi:hypothetical protein